MKIKNVLTDDKLPMEEYAKKRAKDKMPKIRDVTVKRAKGGYIVEVNEEYSEKNSMEDTRKPHVFKNLMGVHQLLIDKFGGS